MYGSTVIKSLIEQLEKIANEPDRSVDGIQIELLKMTTTLRSDLDKVLERELEVSFTLSPERMGR